MSEQKQVQPTKDSNLIGFLTWFQSIEDRLVLASLPVVIFLLILWAISTTFPITATIINLIISIFLLLVTCVMLLRLVEIAWRWAIGLNDLDGDEGVFYVFGIMAIGVLLIGGIACLIDMLLHAGEAPGSRIALFIGLLALLALQYRAIIYRHVVGKQPPEDKKDTKPEE